MHISSVKVHLRAMPIIFLLFFIKIYTYALHSFLILDSIYFSLRVYSITYGIAKGGILFVKKILVNSQWP